MKKERAVVLGGTSDKLFAMAVLMLSLVDTNKDLNADIIIFHDNISKKDQEKFQAIQPCEFKKYNSPFPADIQWHPGLIEHFTSMVFSKYECLRLLETYNAVVWFDYDMLITGDIRELFEPVSGGVRFIMTRTLGDNLAKRSTGHEFRKYENFRGVHASVMAFYDTLPNYMELYKWCLHTTEKYARELELPEQAVFSLMIYEFDLVVYPLSFEIYSPHPALHRGQPWDRYVKVWHTYGGVKYWDGYIDNGWNKYYANYCNIMAECGRE